MNILYLSILYPQGNQNANLYTMLVNELREQGHNVTVVVADEAKNIDRTRLAVENGVEVLRIKAGDQFGVNFIKKGITTLKMEPLLIKAIKKNFSSRRFDVVLYSTPPITFANVVRFCKKKYNCNAYLMLKDIFPQNAVDIGLIKKNSVLHRFFCKKEEQLYRLSDYIGCMSEANIDYLINHNNYLNKENVELFPNTIKVLPQESKDRTYKIREQLGLPNDKMIFVFGGNLGIPQGIDFLIECVAELGDYDNAYFLIIGDGTEREKIETKIEQLKLKNVVLYQRLPKDDYDRLIQECDVGLVLLDKRFTVPNYPSRTLAYMDMALPILAATDKTSDIKALLEEAQCGLWAYSGDKGSFIKKVKQLCENQEIRFQMGQNGRSYLEEYFDVSRSVQILEKHFGNLNTKEEYNVQK